MKKNGLKLFETKTTALKWGINIIKADATDNAQLDLLTALLEQRFSDGWELLTVLTVPPYMVYTLEKNLEEKAEDPWRG